MTRPARLWTTLSCVIVFMMWSSRVSLSLGHQHTSSPCREPRCMKHQHQPRNTLEAEQGFCYKLHCFKLSLSRGQLDTPPPLVCQICLSQCSIGFSTQPQRDQAFPGLNRVLICNSCCHSKQRCFFVALKGSIFSSEGLPLQ